ncbi:hypothetical protein GCM10010423_06060 [Streptomyces levis]|uniref:Uncharacterized protein n=1 Tax=Streptomyces levis TaxID=285566 RepID=A0ABP6AJP5_9ACTN
MAASCPPWERSLKPRARVRCLRRTPAMTTVDRGWACGTKPPGDGLGALGLRPRSGVTRPLW